MTLYELTDHFMQVLEMCEDPDMDEQVIMDTLESVTYEIEDKADGYATIHYELKNEAEKLKAEIDRLTARKRAVENNDKRLLKSLQDAMILIDRRDIATDRFKFKIQKSAPAVVMDEFDTAKIPERFLIWQEPKVDKASLKEAIKNEETDAMAVAHLEASESLRIR